MNDWEQQTHAIYRALIDTHPVSLDELLVPRDHNRLLARAMTPAPGIVPRAAAVLLLFYPCDGELWLPLTARSATLPHHRGEVSLPGGAADPDDDGPVATALRETHEELGIHPDEIDVMGQLTQVYIPVSNFCLNPIVGFMPTVPVFTPNQHEIAEVFCVPLAQLLIPSTVEVEERDLNGISARVPYYALNGYKVWGATALVLSELVARLQRVGGNT